MRDVLGVLVAVSVSAASMVVGCGGQSGTGGAAGENSVQGGSAGSGGRSSPGGASTTPQAGSISMQGGGQATGGGSAGSSTTGGNANGGSANGGSANGGSANGGSAGSPANTAGQNGTLYNPPAKGRAWQLASGDPLNSTPPVLAAFDSGVVLAGASSDLTTLGLFSFPNGDTSEAFVARLDKSGATQWNIPLLPAGLPWAIARTGNDVVTVAPYLPDLAQVSTSIVSKDIYLAKIGGDGTVRFETTVTFEHESTFSYGLAVDASGAIFLAGGFQDEDPMTGLGEHVILIKCDSSGKKLWDKTFTHTGTQGYANAVAVLSSGDIVITGAFDKTLSFGAPTATLTSKATLAGIPSGFDARFTTDGTPVWSTSFDGTDFSDGTALTSLPDGGFLVAGATAANLTLAGKTAQVPPFTPSGTNDFAPTSAFVARLDGAGVAKWLIVDARTRFAHALTSDGNTVLLGGQLDTTTDTGGAVYLRTYAADTGAALQTIQAAQGSNTASSALAANGDSAWVSGIFSGSSDFGNGNVLANANAGVFLLRVEH